MRARQTSTASLPVLASLAPFGQRYQLEPLADLDPVPKMTLSPGNDVPVRVHER